MSHTVTFWRPTEWRGVILCTRGAGCISAPERELFDAPYQQLCVRLPEWRDAEPVAVHHVEDVSAGGQHAWSIDWSGPKSGQSGIYFCTEVRCIPEGSLAVIYALSEWSLWRRVRHYERNAAQTRLGLGRK